MVRHLRHLVPARGGDPPRQRPRRRRPRVSDHEEQHRGVHRLPPPAGRSLGRRRPEKGDDLGRNRPGGRHQEQARPLRVAQLPPGWSRGVLRPAAGRKGRCKSPAVRLLPHQLDRRGAERELPRVGSQHAHDLRDRSQDEEGALAARRQEERLQDGEGHELRMAARCPPPGERHDHDLRQRRRTARREVLANPRPTREPADEAGDARACLPPSEETAGAVRRQCAVPAEREHLRRLGCSAVRQRARPERQAALRRVLRSRQAAGRGRRHVSRLPLRLARPADGPAGRRGRERHRLCQLERCDRSGEVAGARRSGRRTASSRSRPWRRTASRLRSASASRPPSTR